MAQSTPSIRVIRRRVAPIRYLRVFAPTWGGLLLYVLLATLTLTFARMQSIRQYLQLPQMHVESYVMGHVEKLLLNVLGEARTDTIVVGLFWAVVGMFVYIFLRGVARLIYELGSDLDERKYIWPRGADRYRSLELLVERALFRIAVFIVIVLYLSHVLSPALRSPVFADLAGSILAVQYIVWFVALVVAWHGLTVLLRLLLLKERLLG